MLFGVISNYLLHLFTSKALEKYKKEFNMPQITGTYISLFCPLKIKITPFPDGFRTSYSLKVNYKLKVYKLKFSLLGLAKTIFYLQPSAVKNKTVKPGPNVELFMKRTKP